MIRIEDTLEELKQWIDENWSEEKFEDQSQYRRLLEELKRD